MNENLLKEEAIQLLGIDTAAIANAVATLKNAGIKENPFSVQITKGMKFSISDFKPATIKDADGKEGDAFTLFIMSNGARISPKHFQDVRDEIFTLENSIEGVATYALVHKKAETVFKVVNIEETENIYNGKPTQTKRYKLKIDSTRLAQAEDGSWTLEESEE